MYYVDAFTKELVKEKEANAPPERYYEYRNSNMEGLVIETYATGFLLSHPIGLLDFAWITTTPRELVSVQRENHLKQHGLSPNAILYRYAVPPTWYDEEIAKCESEVTN